MRLRKLIGTSLLLFMVLSLLGGCDRKAVNSPHKSAHHKQNTYFSSFSEAPKTLDPARAYNANELLFIAQIYQPPLQYHYLKRPYVLEPLTLEQMPKVRFYDQKNRLLPKDAPPKKIAYSVYRLTIKPGILFQPHPAFAKDERGQYRYHQLTDEQTQEIESLDEFHHKGTRDLTAADYVYQIKRLANPQVGSPIFGLMEKHIVGLSDYSKQLKSELTKQNKSTSAFLDLRDHPFLGAKVINRYTYEIKIKGYYPQFIYWLAMPFFAPVPWEADYFYGQPGMGEHNLTLDWHPVGTGAYHLTQNNPNQNMVLSRNPNYKNHYYPASGEASDKVQGLLDRAESPLPFVDQYIFSLEKESIPRWNKFLQGYYDTSSIGADSFEQAIKIDKDGKAELTPELSERGLRLTTTVAPSIYYFGFNMLDPIVGGYSARSEKLRQAIAIAIDHEERISIFLNGRGIVSHGPIPPGIFGHKKGKQGINPYVYNWNSNKPQKKSIHEAKKLLAEAGYPGGIDPKTRQPLILHYDATSTSGPDEKAQFDWLRKQFSKLDIRLDIRATQYNRFQEKMRTGNVQIFSWGWLADYPDPENFLFLLYGPNAKVGFGGVNGANYNNPAFDRLYEQMKVLPNGPKRQALIDRMVSMVQKDAPWVWGLHPKTFSLSHQWLAPAKPHAMANNTLKYQQINPALRAKKQEEWNKPIVWPLIVALIVLLLAIVPLMVGYSIRIRKRR